MYVHTAFEHSHHRMSDNHGCRDCLAQGKWAPRSPLGLGIVHCSEAGICGMMNGSPEAVITEMGNRIAELERLAIQSNQREQELRRHEQELRN